MPPPATPPPKPAAPAPTAEGEGGAGRRSLADRLREALPDSQRFLLLCIVAGVLCGLAAVAFHFGIHWTFEALWHFATRLGGWKFALVMLLAPALGGLVVGICLRHLPKAAGSGIPQTKAAYYNDFGNIRLRDGAARLVLGSIFIGLGNSLGREGPTIHVCSSIASRLGRWAFRSKARVQAMVPVGMSAGIAAAFNAPLAAITFVFEELLDDFSTKALGGIVVAVVIAAVVSRTILGEEPVLAVELGDDFTTHIWMLVALPLGLACAMVGHLFVVGLLRLRLFVREHIHLPAWAKPALGGLLVGGLGLAAFYLTGMGGNEPQNGVFSIGYESLVGAFTGTFPVAVMAILLVFKLVATWVSYDTGGAGGLFSPTLFFGAMLGGMFGQGLGWLDQTTHVLHLENPERVVGACVLLGMGGMFASVIRCPMTSLLMIFEMTRNYSLMLPLMAGNIIAYFLARRWRAVPLYDALLLQDKISLKRMTAYQGARDWHKLPVKTIMTQEPVVAFAHQSPTANLERLREREALFHDYPVVDAQRRLVGVVKLAELEVWGAKATGKDLTEFLDGRKFPTVHSEQSIREAARTMVAGNLVQVCIVAEEDRSKLLGLLTLNDITRQQNAVDLGLER